MSKNTNLSFLTDYITADITNGRIGINNASPTVAFDVVGATKITGVLTLTSTISNGTFAYTLPSATGTLALTSALSSYLPLTGGTLTGALSGTSATFSSTVTANGGVRTTSANGYQDTDGTRTIGVFSNFTGATAGIGTISNHDLGVYTNATERMRITATGNVGIGTSSPTSYASTTLQVNGSSSSASIKLTNTTTGAGNANGLDILQSTTDTYIYNRTTGMMVFGTSDTERMRITSGGEMLVGITSVIGAERLQLTGILSGGIQYGLLISMNSSSYSGQALRFFNSGTSNVIGSITMSASATAYNTSSDYRLKEDLKPINGLDKVSALNVYDFKWKSSDDRMDGFLAHELQEVLPYAVTGEKDGKEMQGVDYSKLVPVLVKAIQELKAEITILKNK